MLKLILSSLLLSNLFALEISIDSAKENYKKYSTLHLKEKDTFLCEEKIDDFSEVIKIVCAFSKQPFNDIRKIQNDFFEINTRKKNDTFFLIITPFHKIKLIPFVFNLSEDDEVFQADVKISKHWMVIGYDEKMPFINERKKESGINFPFVMKKDKLPYVGALDIKGNPIYFDKVQDVSDYIKIKNYYKDGKYEACIDLISDVLDEYPNSLFKAELLYYKLKVFSKLKDYDNVIELSKLYLREYSSDENVPEVIALTANSYSKIGLNIDADYFFDRLFNEHGESIYSEWGYIYKGEMLEASGASSKALSFYKKALHSTSDINIAATAAYKLAVYYSASTKLADSAKYIKKIIQAKPDFLMNDLKQSMEMMYIFADEGDYLSAAAIAKAIIDETNKNHDEYERLLKDRGIWLSYTDAKDEALESLNRYMKEFKYGTFEDIVKVAKDALFFYVSDDNLTTKLNQYNNLIVEYKDDTIGDKAIYEKAKLLLKNGMYSDVLGFEETILNLDDEIYEGIDEIIIDAATGSMKNYLELNECHAVLSMANDYNITLSNKWDDGIYKCAMKGGDYQLSKKIANKNINSKELKLRKKWLYRYIKIDFAIGNYSDVIEASNDLILLIEDELSLEENSEYKSVYRYLFDAYQRVEESQNMLKLIVDIQKVFGVDYLDIERYIAIIGIGSDLVDYNVVIKYAEDVMSIQKSSSSYIQSPYVEFTLYQAYIAKENFNRALEVIESLNTVELNKSQRSRQKYLLGTIYSKLWRDEEAMQAYQDAIDADSKSAWATLAKSAKEI